MTSASVWLAWLEDKSDWLSPIVVKEVRQVVRGREFAYSFGASLVAGLIVACFGAADALAGRGTTGSWTFFALIGCMAFLGLGVVPLGAFSALRNERLEQTLDLITLTELSPRRIVIGKLLAQGVKLVSLFAAIAPFVAMSFLLGGIDFVTILVSLAVVFVWSLWASALCLFLSTLLKSRAMSGLIFGAVIVAMFLVFALSRTMYFVVSRGMMGSPVAPASGFAGSSWWVLGLTTSFCVVSMMNLVLLAENRLTLPSEDKVTALRTGLLVQLLALGAWLLFFLGASPRTLSNVFWAVGAFGGCHLAVVAMFAITEDLVPARRTRVREQRLTLWGRALSMFRPGGGRGAIYVLAQMLLLIAFAQLFSPTLEQRRWLFAVCGYILFYTGVPVCVFRALRPERRESLKLRLAVFATVPAMLILPDLLYYLLWSPSVFNLNFAARHLINPFRTLDNWAVVEAQGWTSIPLVFGLTGLLAYAVVIHAGTRAMADTAMNDARESPTRAEERDRAGVFN